ncbi:hypothetical protein C8J57DRAFT_1605306 [Mycena rebaudengoi]|nr:hypothetical protein C8J57DRAFT_1605306 [Mycena rebaudengoi]
MAAFKSQIENYTRQYPPFSARSESWKKPMEYWTAMSECPEAAVLAFLAIKIFSVLPNSMPEEQTVSRFMRLDTKDRASQDASTIVNMTKIYQHHRREARKSGKLPTPVSNPPSMNWRSVKNLMTAEKATRPPDTVPSAGTGTENSPVMTISAACEAGLAAVNLPYTEDTDPAPGSLPAATYLAATRDGVATGLPFFRDLLSDAPIPGADDIRSLANWAKGSQSQDKGKGAAQKKKGWLGDADSLVF